MYLRDFKRKGGKKSNHMRFDRFFVNLTITALMFGNYVKYAINDKCKIVIKVDLIRILHGGKGNTVPNLIGDFGFLYFLLFQRFSIILGFSVNQIDWFKC